MDEADTGARAFAAAHAMVGARFRAQGRSAAHGLDCVGLVAAAYAVAGRSLEVPEGYPLRGWRGERIVAGLERAGFVAAADPLRMGDVALIALAAGQFHLGLLAPGRVVHAHAGLRRVVEAPLDARWLEAARWRLVS